MTKDPPSDEQVQFAELPLVDVLLIAPAGCGKTEALACRAKSLIERGLVGPPRRLLALTYSNKAKDNLSSRMREHLGRRWRQSVTVTNFHGLAARLIQNHGEVVGVPHDVVFPDRAWRARRLRELGIGYREAPDFEGVLRSAKAAMADDDEVLARVRESGHNAAIEFEEGLRSEGRIDYDDQIRHAARLLCNPSVVALYRAHFASVMVDEVQDLSMRQLQIVHAVGSDAVTYAGDPAQGIYSFAGADPLEVFAAIRDRIPVEMTLTESFRSSPAVIAAVNTLAGHVAAQHLVCGLPDSWPDEGHVLLVRSKDTAEEAVKVLQLLRSITGDEPLSIGLVARRSARLGDIRELLEGEGWEYTDWKSPTHVPRVVELLKRHLRAAEAMSGGTLESLEELCRAEIDASDAETHDEIASACAALEEMVAGGASVAEAVARSRASPDSDGPVPAGVHLLTGHVGKGQEFDWVVVVGLEEGHVPDFRSTAGAELEEELRVLHVMVSRARYGLVLTASAATRTRNGFRHATESQWLSVLSPAVTAEI